MSDTPSATPGANKPGWAIPLLLSGYLIANFLWRVFTPAHEYPMHTAQMLEMGVDALCIIALIGVRKHAPMPLFWIALIAGIGLFAIRLHSDASWWTGHWTYYLKPR